MAKATPRKGKAKVKVTSSGKKVSYGQAGKAKDGFASLYVIIYYSML